MRPGPAAHTAASDDLAPAPGDVSGPSARLLSRREVLRGLVASGLTAGLIGSLVAGCTDDTGSGASGSDSPTTEAEEAIIRIGRRYREERPGEDDREILLERLGVGTGAVTSPDFLPSLDARAAEDYGADRTVRLDGWVLSLTEGRAAALVSLA